MVRMTAFLSQSWPALLILLALVAAFILFRTQPTELADITVFDSSVAADRPTVVEFYSNY